MPGRLTLAAVAFLPTNLAADGPESSYRFAVCGPCLLLFGCLPCLAVVCFDEWPALPSNIQDCTDFDAAMICSDDQLLVWVLLSTMTSICTMCQLAAELSGSVHET